MSENFKIYINDLQNKPLKIDRELSVDFLQLNEDDLKFTKTLKILGSCCISNEFLILQLNIKYSFTIPCSICNEPANVDLEIKDFCHSEELKNVKNIFDYQEILREAVLLEIPLFTECNGTCLKRSDINKYLKKNSPAKEEHLLYFPFAELKNFNKE